MYYIVYETINLINGKLYRGCHQTDNIDDGYIGSGVLFTKAVEKYGKDNFRRTILCYCNSREEMAIKEREYIDEKWINRHDTYNLQTGGLNTGILCEESKKKISEAIKKHHRNGTYSDSIQRRKGKPCSEEQRKKISETLKSRYKTIVHHQKNKIGWNRGIKRTEPVWNKGLKMPPKSDEIKQRLSEHFKAKWQKQIHPRKGKDPWNKGKKGLQVAWNKGIEKPRYECEYCHKTIDPLNMKRWHGDNCKQKPA